MNASRRQGSSELLELDLLRGFAAILMVVNHAGNSLLDPRASGSGAMDWAIFIGSFAPVVFFFATGFGVAISSVASGRAPSMPSVLQKAVLLFVADQFFYWRSGSAFGLDFLGFIALASVLTSLVACSSRRQAVAWAAIVVFAVLRFGVGPRFVEPSHGGLVDWLLGARGVANISYTLSPWMVLPMFGLAVGLVYRTPDVAQAPRRWMRWSFGVAVVFLSLGIAAGAMGASLFRWGTMGLGFFILCFGVLGAFGCLSIWLMRVVPGSARVLGLRGVASFAVVPVHYVLIDVTQSLFGRRLGEIEFFVVTLVLLAASFGVSRLLADAIARVVQPGRTVLAAVLAAVAIACALALVAKPSTLAGERMALMVVGQLAIACLLGFRAIKRSQTAGTAAAAP